MIKNTLNTTFFKVKQIKSLYFSTTSVYNTDNDILSRINKLLADNKKHQEDSINKFDSSKQEQELENKQLELKNIIYERQESLRESIRTAQRTADIDAEENKKLIDNNTNFSEIQEKIKAKLENETLSTNELYKLQNLYNKLVTDKLERAESIVEAPIWRIISEGKEGNAPSDINSTAFYGFKALAMKEKEKFEAERTKYVSEIKDLEKEIKLKKESPIDFVVDKLESEMPSYTEPEE